MSNETKENGKPNWVQKIGWMVNQKYKCLIMKNESQNKNSFSISKSHSNSKSNSNSNSNSNINSNTKHKSSINTDQKYSNCNHCNVCLIIYKH